MLPKRRVLYQYVRQGCQYSERLNTVLSSRKQSQERFRVGEATYQNSPARTFRGADTFRSFDCAGIGNLTHRTSATVASSQQPPNEKHFSVFLRGSLHGLRQNRPRQASENKALRAIITQSLDPDQLKPLSHSPAATNPTSFKTCAPFPRDEGPPKAEPQY